MKEMGLEPDENRMLIGMVSRLVDHKGLDLVRYIFHDMMGDNVSFVLLGSGMQSMRISSARCRTVIRAGWLFALDSSQACPRRSMQAQMPS